MNYLGGLPTNFEDIHKRKKPSFDQLPDGCFSLSGQYTISHKTRKSRGLVFTTTNKESKSSGLNRLDEMSGCFSLSGQYTISHKTRKSRGLVFTTTNKESKSSGLNRLDEMSFRSYFLIYSDDHFNVTDRPFFKDYNGILIMISR